LPNGEIVPGPALASEIIPGAMVLKWGAGYALQTSTSPLGPFVDVANSFSPFTNHFDEPQRFFRLR
jgi:hypothetical protein